MGNSIYLSPRRLRPSVRIVFHSSHFSFGESCQAISNCIVSGQNGGTKWHGCMHTALMDAEDILSGSAEAQVDGVGNNALRANWRSWMEEMEGWKRGGSK